MNERIKALYTEACKDLDLTDDILQKFAELIVQECIDAVENTNDRHRRDYFAAKIRERFGVE